MALRCRRLTRRSLSWTRWERSRTRTARSSCSCCATTSPCGPATCRWAPPPFSLPGAYLQGWGRTVSAVTVPEVATVEMVHAAACCAYLLELLSFHTVLMVRFQPHHSPLCVSSCTLVAIRHVRSVHSELMSRVMVKSRHIGFAQHVKLSISRGLHRRILC